MAKQAITLTGDKRLLRQFRALDRGAQGQVLTAAALAGAEIIRAEAARLAPQAPGSGRGARNIRIERAKVATGRVGVDIGYDRKMAWHLQFQEMGVAGQPAQPHLRPALDTKREAAGTRIGLMLKLGIDAVRRSQ